MHDRFVNSNSYSKRRIAGRWNKEETERFFDVRPLHTLVGRRDCVARLTWALGLVRRLSRNSVPTLR